MAARHFLTLLDLQADELRAILNRASELKQARKRGECIESLRCRSLGMIFEKSSTRTRVSFEAGMTQLGGHALFLSPRDMQLGRGEPVEDTARVLSRMVDGVMIRTYQHEMLERFAAYSAVPVINGLTDRCHPCQLLADMQTFFEHRGDIQGCTVAWIGDGNNMCNSYINAAKQLDFQLRIACPPGYEPDADIVAKAATHIEIVHDPHAAAQDAHLLTTDVWASMGQEEEQIARRQAFGDYQVNAELLRLAAPDALFMHCLPAHRGEEVSTEVLEGEHSVVWEQAENRLHAQKALMEALMG